MQPQPIENNLIPPTEKGKPNPLTLIILWVGIAFCIAVRLTADPRVISAIALLVLSTALTYLKPEIGVKITL